MRLTFTSCLLPATLAAACGGDDAPPDVATLAIHGDRAALLAARIGQEPWQTFTADAAGEATLEVDGPFELTGVCPDDGGAVYGYAGGVEDADLDPDAYDIGCGALDLVPATLRYAGEGRVHVSVGFGTIQLTGATTLPIEVPAGVHDIVIADRVGHRVAIRRGVTIAANATIDVDLTGAVAMVEHPVLAVPATATVSSTLRTAGGTSLSLARLEPTGWSVPPALAIAGDRHTIGLTDQDPALPRSRFRTAVIDPAVTTPLALPLPPHLTSATLIWARVPSATFAPADDWPEASLFGYPSDDVAPMWFHYRYPHAAAVPGAITAPDPTGLPGWNPSWTVDGTQPFDLYLDLSRTRPDGGREGVSWSRVTTPPDAAATARQATRAAQRERALQRVEAQR